MNRKYLVVGAIVLAVLAVAAFFEPTGVVRGFVRGEPFFDSRPASTWARRLGDSNAKVKEDTQRTLKNGGANAAPVLAAIVHAPSSDWASIPVRVMAIDILAEIGPSAGSAVPALLEALADRDSIVRGEAAAALGAVGPNDDGAISALIAELATPNALAATKALVKCGPGSLRATSSLVKLLSNENSEIRWNAAKTLGKIHALDAIDPLIAALKDPADSVREHVAEALGDMGPAAIQAVEPLIATLNDPYFKARRDAARSLGQIGPAAKAAIPDLEKLSKDDPQALVRDAAALAIKKIGG
jgi:HEAT repeat protein